MNRGGPCQEYQLSWVRAGNGPPDSATWWPRWPQNRRSGGRPENDAGTCLRAARGALTAAELAETPAERYLHAQLAALRVAAVILAARARVRSRGGPRDVWRVVSDVAPEFAEWAGYFAATRGKREAVAAGAVALVSHREADDLVRDAQAFLDVVARRLDGDAGRSRSAG